MADRSIAPQIVVLAAGASNTTNGPVINSGIRIRLLRFGFADDGTSDGKAVTFRLQWGAGGSFADVRLGAIAADTHELDIRRDFQGDGTKFFRVVATNGSVLASRTIAWWVEAQDNV